MNHAALSTLATLIRSQRVGALGTLADGSPLVTMVAYAPAPDFDAFYLHLSGLARHTRAIEADPRMGLMIAEPDSGADDPQRLGRVSLQGTIDVMERTDPAYPAARARYLERLPDAARLFELGDFALYRIQPERGRYVAGFAQSYDIGLRDLQEAARLAG